MIKSQELVDPASCLNKAADDEILFVLRSKDAEAPETIRYWVHLRMLRGRNGPNDAKLLEALSIAAKMETQREQREKEGRGKMPIDKMG